MLVLAWLLLYGRSFCPRRKSSYLCGLGVFILFLTWGVYACVDVIVAVRVFVCPRGMFSFLCRHGVAVRFSVCPIWSLYTCVDVIVVVRVFFFVPEECLHTGVDMGVAALVFVCPRGMPSYL